MDTPLDKPTTDDRTMWQAYWQQQGQGWRTEAESSAERQAYLAERRAIVPDSELGIYPFKDVTPTLTRADIEWLLATHDNGNGPIDWDDESQHERTGLDLRGVDLSGTAEKRVDLHGLPLARTSFSFPAMQWLVTSEKARAMARADLRFAVLRYAQMEGAMLSDAQMQGADLSYTQMEGAILNSAQMEGATLIFAQMEDVILSSAQMEGATLRSAQIKGATLTGAQMKRADLSSAQMEGADLSSAQMKGANLSSAQMKGAILSSAQMEGADLRAITCDSQTRFDNVVLDAHIQVADVTWGGTNLVNIDWTPVARLGDEATAHPAHDADHARKERAQLRDGYRAAVRAYRLLATALRDQGMNEEADRFAYRAQVCQRAVWRFQQRRGQWFWSGVLDLIAGYGYRPVRSFLAYLCIILTFAGVYFLFGQTSHALSPPESVVVSMTAFHGRGFFANQFQPGDPQAYAASIEAFLGLMIEVSFIATFTQRYFGK